MQADFLSGLNAQQREAVTTIEGPVLILAGAGSGKTRVITFRIACMIESGVRPDSILAVTFTNKAAGEMKERVEKLLAGKPRQSSPLLSTFHSLCVRILRRDIEKLGKGYTRSFTIYDADDQQKLLRACIKDCGFDDKQITARLSQTNISGAKNRGEDPETFALKAEHAVDPKRAQIARVYALYEQRLQASNALDFDDLLIRTVQLLRTSEEARRYYQNRFRHVMVDEFQDTNGIQYSLCKLLVEGDIALNLAVRPADFWTNRSLCVVGDENQSIYKFRGSDFNIILNFERDFPGTKTIKLEDNYRSTARILDAANKVIAHNSQRFDKRLRANAVEGEKIRYAQVYDGEAEARWVADKISEHINREPKLKAAVLYRTNAQSRSFEEACRRAGLRYNLVGGFSFYERAEVKDIIAYLKLALNPDDSIALLRIINTPARGIGKSTMDEVERKARELHFSHWEAIAEILKHNLLPPRSLNVLRSFRNVVDGLIAKSRAHMENGEAVPVADLVKAAVIDTGYELMLKEERTEEAEGRLLNLEELVNAAAETDARGETLRDFLDHAALVSDTDQYKAEAQVTLMTMHAAKGLEFPLVFIAGLEENLFPHSRATNDQAELEEERRLCYVAITRAEKYLYLTHAMKRRTYGEEIASEPSRFLNEFPIELIEDLSKGPSWLRFANKVSTKENLAAIDALTEKTGRAPQPAKRTSNYQGQAYNSRDSVNEFFKRQGIKVDADALNPKLVKRDSNESSRSNSSSSSSSGGSGKFKVGTRVRHAKFGIGLVVRSEGEGDNVKLTINFPGYGQKKMVEKFAGLEKA
ncbi:MAG: UvrD-helicase domain-containing protein [Acidobacteria bacterium]|nr:UvrD-helicase domain-containing protein [Acidobacteriota bacterium]